MMIGSSLFCLGVFGLTGFVFSQTLSGWAFSLLALILLSAIKPK